MSVLSTIAAGATLAADYLADRVPVLEPLRRFAAGNRVRGALGAVALVVGFVLLWWRSPPRQVAGQVLFRGQVIIVGDILPAIAGMLLGAMLLIGYYRDRRGLPDDGDAAEQAAADVESGAGDATPESSDSGAASIARIDDALKPYWTPVGLAGIVVGVVHFLLPSLAVL